MSQVTAAKTDASIPWNKHVHQHRKPSDWVIDIAIAVILVLVVFIVIYPIWFIIIASFSDQSAVSAGQVRVIPHGFNVYGYKTMLTDSRIWSGYKNTIIYSILGTLLNLAVTMPAAFALSRKEFKPRRILMLIFTITMFFSGGMIPSYLLMKQLGLLNSMWVFILPGAVSVWNLIIARSFFETSIPEDLHDAAQIDGLSYFGYFFKVVLPLSAAILAVIGLYYFVGHWNDYFTGLIYVNDQSKLPLQNVLQQILLANQTQQMGHDSALIGLEAQRFADQIKYGVIIVATLPLLIIYPFLQKYFEKGVMVGAVKG
jgi:putative aldouronate transport system permease protein